MIHDYDRYRLLKVNKQGTKETTKLGEALLEVVKVLNTFT